MMFDIVVAAGRVLQLEGARHFTTVRVAEMAGVSVGSLYQYFPNKEALLFRIQADEWIRTRAALEAILTDARFPPLTRLRRAIRAFFRSERDEADYRIALDDAGVLIRDVPEARAHQEAALQLMRDFLDVAIPSVPTRQRTFTAALVGASLESLGEQISRHHLSDVALDRWARAAADMHCGYLARLERLAAKHRAAR
jgi:AcrR family transcriptional regulator